MAYKELTKTEISNLSPEVKKAIKWTIDNPRYVGDYSNLTSEQTANYKITEGAKVFIFDSTIYHLPSDWVKKA